MSFKLYQSACILFLSFIYIQKYFSIIFRRVDFISIEKEYIKCVIFLHVCTHTRMHIHACTHTHAHAHTWAGSVERSDSGGVEKSDGGERSDSGGDSGGVERSDSDGDRGGAERSDGGGAERSASGQAGSSASGRAGRCVSSGAESSASSPSMIGHYFSFTTFGSVLKRYKTWIQQMYIH